MVRFAALFDVHDRTVTFLSGKSYGMEELQLLGAGDLLISMFEFSEKLSGLHLAEEEMSLFTAVVLVSAGKRIYDLFTYTCVTVTLDKKLIILLV